MWDPEFVPHQGPGDGTGHEVRRPCLEEPGETIEEVHHHGHAEAAAQPAGRYRRNGVLGEEDVESFGARHTEDEAFERRRIGEVAVRGT
jgi:hypothetical protein